VKLRAHGLIETITVDDEGLVVKEISGLISLTTVFEFHLCGSVTVRITR
jgi:hypothetical protein